MLLVLFVTMSQVTSTHPGKAPVATSATERALLGSSYSEDCLFGSDYQLFRGVSHDSIDQVNNIKSESSSPHGDTTEVSQTSFMKDIPPHPAFIPKKNT